jgi:hypothetical protein
MKNDKDKNTKTVEVEAFATERMVLEMDAKHSEPPAELRGMVITELSGGSVSRAASRSRRIDQSYEGRISRDGGLNHF